MAEKQWKAHNPDGSRRVVVTKELPGTRWIGILARADCRVEVCMSTEVLTVDEIIAAMGHRCDGAIGQLTEPWGEQLFAALKAAGGTAYSNYAVGFNNVDVAAATIYGLPVGNTPGVLTETTAEMAAALTLACARRLVEADRFTRAGRYEGWLPTLFLGQLLRGKTVGIIGAGRIGSAYARLMVEGFKMNALYYDLHANQKLEDYVQAYSAFLETRGEPPVRCRRAATVEEVFHEAEVVSLHTVLDETSRHLVNAHRLSLMKENAILVNASRGPVVDEAALVEHCRAHPGFQAGLDVFEEEPALAPGLVELDNVTIPPHIASATLWTRCGMADLAACNVAAILSGYPVWGRDDVTLFLEGDPPQAAPSIINASELGLSLFREA